MTTFNNTREIENKIDELEGELEAYHPDAYTDFFEDTDDEILEEKYGALRNTVEGVFEELSELIDFKTDLESYCDWYGGETLIHEDDRVSYAKQLAEDCDNIPHRWPFDHIDWHAAADNLFDSDYHSADLNGSTFYVRMN